MSMLTCSDSDRLSADTSTRMWRGSYEHVIGEMICCHNGTEILATCWDSVGIFAGGHHDCDGGHDSMRRPLPEWILYNPTRSEETMTIEPWYDTEAGLTSALERGLVGLHEIRDARMLNYGKQNLHEWCLMGRFVLDSVGNFSAFGDGDPADNPSYEIRKRIRPAMWARDVLGLVGIFSTHACNLPTTDDRCDRCLDGWSLESAHDVLWERDAARPRHKICNELAVVQESMAEVYEILAAAEIHGDIFFVPNRYWPGSRIYDDVRTPWAVVHTEKGPLRIGWRKRVISIDWGIDGTKFTATGPDVAAGDSTTTGHQLIHAWSRDKAVEYLKRLWAGGAT